MRDLAIQNAIGVMQRALTERGGDSPSYRPSDKLHQELEWAIDGLLSIGKVEHTASLYDRARKAGITPMPTEPYIEYNLQSIPLHV